MLFFRLLKSFAGLYTRTLRALRMFKRWTNKSCGPRAGRTSKQPSEALWNPLRPAVLV